ncbi:MAG: TPM domain-containing protein [Chitinophagales bacterium]
MSKAENFFASAEQQEIILAIQAAEKITSGEIRIHLESSCPGEPMQRAQYWFGKLRMQDTQAHNGVLIYIATADKKCAILGDAGIHAQVPDNFWDLIIHNMLADFSAGNYVPGLTAAIHAVGEQLKQYFPLQPDDINELSDEITFS